MTTPKTTTTLTARDLPAQGARHRTLRIVHSPDKDAVGRAFDLDGRSWALGRDVLGPGCINDGWISREHIRVVPGASAGSYLVEDLKTKNGSFLNGRRLDEPTWLSANDILSAGDTLMVVDEELDPDLLPCAPGVAGEDVRECVGISHIATRLRSSIATVAGAPGSVLILGPTGAGKEVAARAIHRLSGGDPGPFVPVNCGAIPEELAEAELFGASKGAFTGADRDRAGYFLQASRGTIFLDEVGDLPPLVQTKLLRVLQDGLVQPLGGGEPRQVKVRVIAATHKGLDGPAFRRDLLARLSDWLLHLPPLASRRADILVLWDHFQRTIAGAGAAPRPFTSAFAEGLLLHSWPMNIREIEKLAMRIKTLTGGTGELDLVHLPAGLQAAVREKNAGGQPAHREWRQPREAPEAGESPFSGDDDAPAQAKLELELRKAGGNVTSAAKQNGWHKTQVYRWLKRYNLDPERFR